MATLCWDANRLSIRSLLHRADEKWKIEIAMHWLRCAERASSRSRWHFPSFVALGCRLSKHSRRNYSSRGRTRFANDFQELDAPSIEMKQLCGRVKSLKGIETGSDNGAPNAERKQSRIESEVTGLKIDSEEIWRELISSSN